MCSYYLLKETIRRRPKRRMITHTMLAVIKSQLMSRGIWKVMTSMNYCWM